MGVPEGSLAIAAFIVLALPGFILAAVGRWARGESTADRDVGLTFARGTVFAVGLTALYLVVFGAWLYDGLKPGAGADAVVIANPRLVGLAVLIFYVVIPAALSVLINWKNVSADWPAWVRGANGEVRRGFGWVRLLRSRHGYSSMPSAWNHAAEQNHDAWVKVKRSNGDWVGGWFSKGSFVTTYPEPNSIYIAHQFQMNDQGMIVGDDPIPGAGVFLMINDDDMVFWDSPKRAQAEKDGSDG